MALLVDNECMAVFERAMNGVGATKEELGNLLSFDEVSAVAGMMRLVADKVIRQLSGNKLMLLGQIGVEIFPCPANCKFCSFAEKYTSFESVEFDRDKVGRVAQSFMGEENMYAVFLMLMHEYDFDALLDLIALISKKNSSGKEIVVNIGDFSRRQAELLKEAGATGAYHVLRIREGVDTELNPEDRKKTIENISHAGLHWYNCCEPVGPEHSVEEIVEQIFLGIEFEPFQHAAMRRVVLPGSPLAKYGQISELRLAQIVAGVTLAMAGNKSLRSIAVHEPNMLGLISGANSIYAEAGGNPRDLEADTSNGRGFDVEKCMRFAVEAGFEGYM